MKLLFIKKRLVLFAVNRILAGTFCFDAKRRLLLSIGCEIGEGTKVTGPVYCTGKLIIGRNCWINKNLTVHGNGTVIIGDNCDIAPEVAFLTGGHTVGEPFRRAGAGETYDITVGEGTWIGARSTVLGNTRIGGGCVIAACSCVVKDVPDHSLFGGVPAEKIRDLKS